MLKERHTFPPSLAISFQQYWEYHKTPKPPVRLPTASRSTRSITGAHRAFLAVVEPAQAIALDCEMGTAVSGDAELIRLTAIDFFTQKVLVDKLVQPSVPMRHFNTRFSGITAADMRNAVRRQECLFGRENARNELWKFVGPDTVVIVHGGHNDLSVLRWIHPALIDSFILEGYRPRAEGGRSLKSLCDRILNLQIQEGRGHDSFEDAAACRELVRRWMLLIPD